MANDLVLDTAIRNWVLIPLPIFMILIKILKYFVSKLRRTSELPNAKKIRKGQLIIRARNLRAAANFIPPKAFHARKYYYTNEENGLVHVPKEEDEYQNPHKKMLSNPDLATKKLKKQLFKNIGKALGFFSWNKYFFSGFVAAKIPFPLILRFRSMLQNGIELSTVDVSYVSSRSWYLLNLYGLGGFYSLILGEENATDDTKLMLQISAFHFGPFESLEDEKDGLDLVQHEWVLPKYEQRAAAVLRKLVS